MDDENIVGRKTTFENNGRLMHIQTLVDVEDVIDDVKEAADENKGFSKSRNFRRIGSIPLVFVDEMFRKGINLFDGSEDSAKIAKKWLREHSKFNTGSGF